MVVQWCFTSALTDLPSVIVIPGFTHVTIRAQRKPPALIFLASNFGMMGFQWLDDHGNNSGLPNRLLKKKTIRFLKLPMNY